MSTDMTFGMPGDHSRFERLMAASHRKVYAMALRLSGNRTDAEDLTQEAYFRAFRSFKDYEGDRPFENWILRIVSRLFLDLLRARRRRIQAYSYDAAIERDGAEVNVFSEIPDKSSNPEDILLSRCMDVGLEDCLRDLTPEQRDLIHMADIEQLSYKEIAEIVGAPIGTIRSRLHRAHKALRKRIGEVKVEGAKRSIAKST